MEELIAGFGLFAGLSLLILGVLALLVPFIIFLGYGELRRIRKSTENIEIPDLEEIKETLARMDRVIIRANLDYKRRIANDQDNSTKTTN